MFRTLYQPVNEDLFQGPQVRSYSEVRPGRGTLSSSVNNLRNSSLIAVLIRITYKSVFQSVKKVLPGRISASHSCGVCHILNIRWSLHRASWMIPSFTFSVSLQVTPAVEHYQPTPCVSPEISLILLPLPI